VTNASHEVPVKAVVIVAGIIACGIALLLLDPFSPRAEKKSGVDKGNKSPKAAKGQADDFDMPGSGRDFADYRPDEGGDRRRARVEDVPVSGSDQGTNNPVVAALRVKYNILSSVRKVRDRRDALLQFGRDLAKNDPAGGLAFLKSFGSDFSGFRFGFGFGQDDISVVCQGFFETASTINLNNAMSMALDLPRQFHRAALGTVMKTWAGSDLGAAIAYLDKLPPDYAHHGAESVFSVWGEKDPGAALTGALKFKDPASDRMFQSALMSVIDGWSNVDPKAAWGYVLNPDDAVKDAFSRKDRYLSMIAAKWAEKDLDGAMEALKAFGSSSAADPYAAIARGDSADRSYQRMVEFMTMRLLETNPEAADKLFDREKWLAGNPWLSTKNVGRLIDEGAVTEAADWMIKIPDKNSAFECARQLASRRTETDYDSVFKWASMIPDDYIKAGALSNVAAQQAQHDIDRPIDWIYDLPDGYSKERSIAGYVLGKVRKTRDRELESELRQQMAGTSIDMAGLAQVIDRSKMNPIEKSVLMNLVENRRPQKPLVIQ
jgi:hypothetical protein